MRGYNQKFNGVKYLSDKSIVFIPLQDLRQPQTMYFENKFSTSDFDSQEETRNIKIISRSEIKDEVWEE